MRVKRWGAFRLAVMTFTVAATMMMASCGDDDDDEGAIVDVTLREFTVTPEQTSAPPGLITFVVTNAGTEEHEFLVIRTDLPPDELPTEDDGSYEEDGPGTELIHEIEPFEPGETEQVTLTLQAGSYVLICNLVEIDGDEVEAHYSLGMFAAFTVE